MSRLHIVIGYPDLKPDAEPFPVFVGSDADAGRQAMAQSTAARFVILANPLGLRKQNLRATENAAAAAAAASRSAESGAERSPRKRS